MKKTKIVATISDLKCDVEFLKELHESGMNVVRINTAHQEPEDTLKIIKNTREVSPKIPIIIDTKGPEVRTAPSEDGITLEKGQQVLVSYGKENSTNQHIRVSYEHFVRDVPSGAQILIDDGELGLTVIDKNETELICKADNAGSIIKDRKSVNVPGASLKLPSLTEKDIRYIKFACEQDVEFVAHSFIRHKEDVLDVQRIIDEQNSQVKIIAKIENQEGVDNLDEILDHLYGVMIARGDMAIEIPAQKVPRIQKEMIEKCMLKRKPVITATQMLHSMIKNPRPTRAEVSDVANAVFDGTDALMLSGETSYGKYAKEAVQMMRKIAIEAEQLAATKLTITGEPLTDEVTSFLAKTVVLASEKLSVKAIVADTETGRTVRCLSTFRPKVPIYAQCYDERTMRELMLSYGVHPRIAKHRDTADEFVKAVLTRLTERGRIEEDDQVVVFAGNFGPSHGASFVEITTAKSLLN